MLEDSQLQNMRLGESNIRHFEDSDIQILGFRCFIFPVNIPNQFAVFGKESGFGHVAGLPAPNYEAWRIQH